MIEKKQPDHDDRVNNTNNQSYHIKRMKGNGFRQPCLKKNEESEEKQWSPTAFLINMNQFSLKCNIGIEQKMNEKSEEKLWFPTAFLIAQQKNRP